VKKKPPQKKTSERQPNDFAKKVFDKSAALAAAAMRGADSWQRIGVYLCYFMGTIALVILFMPPHETNKQLITGGGTIIFFFIALMFVFVRYRKLSSSHDDPATGEAESLLATDVQLSVADREKIREVLENARKEAFAVLRAKNGNLVDDNVRANIFFPKYGPSKTEKDYCLKIEPGLHRKMNSEAELEIVLEPGQGATGYAFQTGQPRVARRIDAGQASRWEKFFHITPELEQIINPDLQWIISMPLKSGGKSIGVMNIDGLIYEFNNDILQECATELTAFALIIAGLIERR
jgi:hypothetical protein